MANWYVNSLAGTGTGTSWAGACASLSALLALGSPPVAGDSIFIYNSSAETYAATTTLTFPGTPANPNLIYSVNTLTDQPPTSADLASGASVSVANGSTTVVLTLGGSFYCYGVTFNAGASTAASCDIYFNSTTNSIVEYDTCSFNILASGASGLIKSVNGGFNGQFCTWTNCTVKFGVTSGQVAPVGTLTWRNTASAVQGATIPTTLIGIALGSAFFGEGLDLSAPGSGKTLIGLGTGSLASLKDSKINASATVAATPTTNGQVFVSRCDSSGTENVFQLYDYAGTETSNTSVNRTGGASDFSSNAFSKKIVTTANAQLATRPFKALPMSVVNTLVGSTRTVTIYGVWDSPYGANTPPNNNDIWVEVEYPKDSGDPLGGFVNSGPSPLSPLTTGSAYTQDVSSTWNGVSGFTHATAWTMVVTLTAQIAGPLTIRIYAAKASQTFYVDAAALLS